MRRWYNDNKEEIELLLEQETCENPTMLLPYPAKENIVPVATAAASIKILKTAWIEGKMTFPAQERNCWYTACGNCHKSIDADLTWIVTCLSCKLLSEVRPMARLTIVVNDESGSIVTSICTPEVEQFIPYTAVQLKESDELGIDVSDTIASSIREHTIVAFLRSFEVTVRGDTEMKVSVVKAYKSNATNLQQPTKPTSFPAHDTQKKQQLPVLEPTTPAKRQVPSSARTAAKIDAVSQVTRGGPAKKTKECSV